MTPDMPRRHEIHLVLETADELADLERAILKARATELGEVRRRDVRLVAGYRRSDDARRDGR